MTLKECPFCGGEGRVMATDDTYRHVECKECNARGPNSPTIEDAMFCWNQRWDGRWCEA